MRIVAFIIEPATVRTILAHLSEPIHPPPIAPARRPPPRDMSAARGQLDPQAHLAPAYEFDQRIAW